MYFNVNQYPALRGKSQSARRDIITTALRRYDRWITKRILLVVCSLIGLAGGGVQVAQRYSASAWIDWAILFAAALLFYGYILREINGPVLRAVENYISDQM